MEDLIRRSDAIKALIEWYGCKPDDIEAFEKIIKTIPTADRPQLDKDVVEPIGNGNVIMSEDTYEELLVDRPQGEWIDEHEDGHGSWVGTCNQCGKENHVDNFCPHCGVRMKGADNFDKTHEVVANGNCAICGKPLSGNRVFICEECSKKGADDE